MILDPLAIEIILLLMVAEGVITFDQYKAMMTRFKAFLPYTLLSDIRDELLEATKKDEQQ